MEKPTQLRYQDIPENRLRSKGLTSWSAMDLWVLSVSVLVMLAVGAWVRAADYSWSSAFIAALFTGIFTLPCNFRFHKGRGRLYAEFYSGLKSAFIIYVFKRVLFVDNDTSSGLVRWLRSKITAVPLRLGLVTATVDDVKYRFTLVHQKDKPLDHLLIIAEGGSFGRLDADQQFRATDELAAVINVIIAQSELKCGVSYGRITGPGDESEVLRYYRTSSDPTVARPDQFKLDEDGRAFADWLRQDAGQLMPVAKSFGSAKTWGFIVISIRRDRHWRGARKGKYNDQQLYDLPIIELGRDLIEALQASSVLQLKNVHNPGLAELGCLIRCGWDTVGIDKYFMDRAAGLIPTTEEEIDAILATGGAEAVEAALQCWPQKLIAVSDDGNMLQMDGNWIQTIRVTKMPQRVRADQFMALHHLVGKGVWTRNAMVGEAVSGNVETQSSIYNTSFLANAQQLLNGNRIVQNPNWARRKRNMQNQIEQISQNSVAQHFNMPRVIISDSARTTKRQMSKLRALLQAQGFRTEEIDTPAEQVDAAISGCYAFNRF